MSFGAFLLTAVVASAAAQAPADGGRQTHKDVAYGDHERQKLDVFVPKSEKPLPLIIWVHGGGWEAGSKDGNPATLFLGKGYAVAGVNYRLSKHAAYPAQLHDVKSAVRYLRASAAKYNLNPDKFGVWGASAGGHLVALLGTTAEVKELEGDGKHKEVSSRVQAVCDWFGPTDLTKLALPGGSTNAVTRLLGGDGAAKKDVAATGNPINYVTKDDAPFLILHGTKDPLVPLSQSEMLHESLKKAGVPSELIVVAGAGHGDAKFREPFTTGEHKNAMSDFFEKYLKK